ncbi:protein mono-ADP-ribosyltransferase PARP15-like isoform X2 [Melanotaenia boesemani]|uniref:protein mono-ADP-ribosyltransferase PARP15-like isoform X2 n=1 Tax=Melanotaenia boesemani TaxID=1250792 RepID=UPI001C03B45E|nr:protein mono-ADP-ribosyltransferase PARP15-like isoform X2 [Melanotaenia boesemani]
MQTIQEFCDAFMRWFSCASGGSLATSSSKNTGPFFKVVSSSGMCEAKMGNVTLQVATGDITQETTDVIVNSSNEKFTLKTGVSKAILDAAGQAVEARCRTLGLEPNPGMIMTQPGNLKCKKVLHLVGQTDPVKINKVVKDALQMCIKNRYRSVSFPAIGTGQGNAQAKQVADSMFDAVIDVLSQNPSSSLTTIRIVIFQQTMLQDFSTSMQQRAVTDFSGASGGSMDTSSSKNYRRSAGFPAVGDIPAHWDSMPPTTTCELFPIPAGTPEYNDVLTLFRATCNCSVIKIERIQNPGLWKSLQIKKEELEMRNGHQNNERRLFHGTTAPTIPIVNELGFNRSYAGKNPASYGNGSYFAVNASYSADDTYSKPNQNGEKFMYLCRVLVGDFTVGQSGMITPPAKGSSITEMFDSVVDNMSKPSMFVIFNDIQAYPEYLITFK